MRPKRAWPLRLRLTLWYTAVLAGLVAVFSGFVYVGLSRSLIAQVDESLRLVATEAALDVQNQDGILRLSDPEEPTALPALLASRGYALRLVTETGGILDGTGEFRRLPEAPPVTGSATLTAAGEDWRVYTVPLTGQEPPGRPTFLQAAQSLAGVKATRAQLARLLAVGAAVAVGLAAAGGTGLARRALGPIDAITRQARQIGAAAAERRPDALGRRLNLDLPPDEVGRLAGTFDEMLARLEEAFRRERQFTSDAAHELRTPLTALKGAVDVALRRERTAAQYRDVLTGLGREVDRLIALSRDLLALARAESRAVPDAEQPAEVDLSEVAASAVDRLRPLAEAKGVTLALSAADHPRVAGDAAQLERAVTNLIDNAVKFTPRGGRVTVTCREAAAEAVAAVEVADTGCGIPPEDLPRVFDRFYRVDRARSREGAEAGAGLGLTIARAIARRHGGDIVAESSPGRGSTFTLRLPASWSASGS